MATTASPPPRTPPGCATRSGWRSRPASRRCSPNRSRIRSLTSSVATPAPTVRSPSTACAARLHVPGRARRGDPAPPRTDRPRPAGRVPARRVADASGSTPRCCGASNAGRWRRSAARSNRSSPPCSAASCRRGTASGAPTAPAAGAASTRSSTWSPSSRARPIPASVLETDVLPARLDGYRPGDLDELIAAGEVVWLGVEPVGTRDGRVVLCFRDQVPLLVPLLGPATPWTSDPPAGETGPSTTGCSTTSRRRGASFWPDLLGAAGGASAEPGLPDAQEVLDALWDLVWDGPGHQRHLPAGARPRRRRSGASPAARDAGRTAHDPAARPVGSPRRSRPLVADPRPPRTTAGEGDVATTGTEQLHALAEQLLERHGVLTREAMRAESVRGGLLDRLPGPEGARGVRSHPPRVRGRRARRGAVRRSRSDRPAPCPRVPPAGGRDASDDPAEVVVLAATDPAQPYGAALAWPPTAGRPARAAGAFVVLVGGEPAVVLERGGRSLTTFEDGPQPADVGARAARPGRSVGACASSRSPAWTGPRCTTRHGPRCSQRRASRSATGA